MIIYVVTGVVGTPPHISPIPVAATIITPWGKADPGNVWLVMSALWRMVQFPFRLQPSCIAKHNKWPNHWRKWEHATVRAWERNRTGTSAWLSSDGPHRNKGFGSVAVIGVFPCFHICWSATTLKQPQTPVEVNTTIISLRCNNMLRNTGSWHINATQHNNEGVYFILITVWDVKEHPRDFQKPGFLTLYSSQDQRQCNLSRTCCVSLPVCQL